jgi:hypothetical protein
MGNFTFLKGEITTDFGSSLIETFLEAFSLHAVNNNEQIKRFIPWYIGFMMFDLNG